MSAGARRVEAIESGGDGPDPAFVSGGVEPLRARAILRLVANAPDLLQRLGTRFAEHSEVAAAGNRLDIATDFGRARLLAEANAVRVSVAGDDETALAFMKMAVAEHLLALAGRAPPPLNWTGDGCAAGAPPFFREMRVSAVRQVTPGLRRLTLSGSDLARFGQGGLHVRLLIPPNGARSPVWPVLEPDGRLRMPGGADALVSRVYTVRRIDAGRGEIDVDMVLHPGDDAMPGARFAAGAQAGDVVGMTGPGGGDLPPFSRPLLLFGDETALPAIARILASLPPSATARAYLEVADAWELQALPSPAATGAIEWRHRGGVWAGTGGRLADAARGVVGPEQADCFVWAAGEFGTFRAIRAHLRGELKRDRSDHFVASFWRRGVTGDGKRVRT